MCRKLSGDCRISYAQNHRVFLKYGVKEIQNIPTSGKQRIVVVGAGFAGLELCLKLRNSAFQVVLLNKENYHQFQPLFYQVATAGLEPSSISFPLRKIFHRYKNIHVRIATVDRIETENQYVHTDIGSISYDYLVIACGGTTNYFGMTDVEQHSIPMKSTSEALKLRNTLLGNFEKALNTKESKHVEELLSVVIVGGGPTGVELSGAIAEMKKYVLPSDYPELDFGKMKITLVEAGPRLLNGMSDHAAENALKYLNKLDVKVELNTMVQGYDGHMVSLKEKDALPSRNLIWAAGIKSNVLNGINEERMNAMGRLKVDSFNKVQGTENIFALGDCCIMELDKYPKGHPQVAQVAIQQSDNLAANLKRMLTNKTLKSFEYVDKGSLATVGRQLAVGDLPFVKLKGLMAWMLWLFVHLMAILGVKNRLFIFINWMWSYFTYDQSLRLIIKTEK